MLFLQDTVFLQCTGLSNVLTGGPGGPGGPGTGMYLADPKLLILPEYSPGGPGGPGFPSLPGSPLSPFSWNVQQLFDFAFPFNMSNVYVWLWVV